MMTSWSRWIPHSFTLRAPALWILGVLGVVLALSTSAGAADDQDTLKRTRIRAGVWLGGGLATGTLATDADTARVRADLKSLATVQAGVDLWSEEKVGLYAGLSMGTGADITEPATASVISYNLHQFEVGARYRWFTSARADAFSLAAGLGIRVIHQEVQVQRPSILLTTTTSGPEFSLGPELPFLGGRVWTRLTGRVGVPFLVRESEDDSGVPDTFLWLGGRGEVVVHLTGLWAAQLNVDWISQSIDFTGQGTRGPGTGQAQTDDTFLNAGLMVRRVF